jgi:spore coat protein CotH
MAPPQFFMLPALLPTRCHPCHRVALLLALALPACGGSDPLPRGSGLQGSGATAGLGPVGTAGASGESSTEGTVADARGPWIAPTFDPSSLPTEVPTVELVVDEADRASLDDAPFYGPDVVGDFVDEDGARHAAVDVNYRGAYALLDLIESDPIGRRNWKVKFPSEDRYRGRREWNYTFSPNLRQLLAYDLMRFADVRVPSARHVRLAVNGQPQGLYLEYEDPDSKDWLWDMFGDDTGDLYKAALDLPASEGQPEQKYFADTTYLGPDDASYPGHYNKKTNHKDPTIADDYGAVRGFLEPLNALPDEELVPWVRAHFQLDRFLSFLVVSNFISNWDSFPQRPKNFWLFEVRGEGRLAFIPWDLDCTFQQWTDSFNQMGTEADIFYNLRRLDYQPYHWQEGDERPLVWRLFQRPEIEAEYVARYRALSETLLSESSLNTRIDALAELVEPALTDAPTGPTWDPSAATERSDFHESLDDMRAFVTARTAAVRDDLAAIP